MFSRFTLFQRRTPRLPRLFPARNASKAVLLLPAVIVLACWLLSAVAMFYFLRTQAQSEYQDFTIRAGEVTDNIIREITTYNNVLRGAAAHLLGEPESVTRDQWRTYVAGLPLERNYRGLKGVGIILPVEPESLDAFRARMRLDDAPDFEITEVRDVPPEQRVPDRHYVITFIEPAERNAEALGLDLASEPNRRAALEYARTTGRLALTRPIHLVQDQQQRTGFLLILPIHKIGPLRPERGEPADLVAWAYAPFVLEEFIEAALRSMPRDLSLEILMGQDEGPPAPIYQKFLPGHAGRKHMEHIIDQPFGGQVFRFRMSAPTTSDAALILIGLGFLLLGTGIGLPLAGLVLALQRTRARAEALANQRTRDLRLREQELETKLLELRDAQERLERQSVHLRDLAEAAAADRDRATLASRSKSDFLAMMSHEIRTPLNGTLGMISLLDDGSLRPDQRRLVHTARDSAEYLLTLINDILDFSKLEARKVELEEIDFDLHQLVDGVLAMLQPKAVIQGLRLDFRMAPGMPACFVGDPSRLRQILFNLVGNALKFTRQGSVDILASARPAGDGAAPRWHLRVEVTDTGIGIPKDKQASLFAHFTQASRTVTREFGGTGLGLAISKQLVGLMGGEIGVISEEGRGSTFWFEIDLSEGRPVAANHFLEDAENGPAARGGLRLLVAEDNQVNQMVIGMMLRRLGHRVDMVNDGQEATEAVVKMKYDLVLMDLQMPVMDGLTAAAVIRRLRHEASRVPIIALTANAMTGDREKYLAAGMDEYVSKPIELRQLLAAMNRALAKSGRAEMAAENPPSPSPSPASALVQPKAVVPPPVLAAAELPPAESAPSAQESLDALLARLSARPPQ